MREPIQSALHAVASFFDSKRVGAVGPLGFRRSTDLEPLVEHLVRLHDRGLLLPERTAFLDLGCGDGRVSLCVSTLVKASVGVEIEEWILDEHAALRAELEATLAAQGHPPLPDNVTLVQGDAMDAGTYGHIHRATGLRFEDFDVLYTYLLLYEEYARMIARSAKPGALYLVNGLGRAQPRLEDLDLAEDLGSSGDGLRVYRKPPAQRE